jgi:hypothetical protein
LRCIDLRKIKPPPITNKHHLEHPEKLRLSAAGRCPRLTKFWQCEQLALRGANQQRHRGSAAPTKTRASVCDFHSERQRRDHQPNHGLLRQKSIAYTRRASSAALPV